MPGTRIGPDSLLHLVGLAYEAAQNRSKWSVYLEALTETLAGRGAVLIHHDLKTGGSVVESVRLDPQALALYGTHYHSIDVWALSQRARALTLAQSVVADQQLVDRAALRRTEFYGDLVSRFDMARMTLMTVAPPSPPIMTFRGVTIFRSERDPEFAASELSFLEALVPHLRRAFQIHDRLSAADHEQRTLLETLDALPCAVYVVNGDAAVIAANRAGAGAAVGRDGVGLVRRVLVTSSADTTRRLRDLCAGIANGVEGIGSSGGAIVIRRASSPVPVQVLVAPLAASRDDRAPSGGTALVFVSDPLRDRMPSETLLRYYYGLTKSESEIAARIASGQSLSEIAAERGTTVATVRWYNKQVLAKTSCRSRAELVRQLARSLSSLFPDADVQPMPK